MNLSTLWGGFRVFQKGAELTNSESWKSATALAAVISAFLLTLLPFLRNFWPDLPQLSEADVMAISLGIAKLVLWIVAALTLATSKRVGIGTAKPLPEEATTTGLGPDAQRAQVEPLTDQKARDAGLGS